jgi:chromosome segregation ATPase
MTDADLQSKLTECEGLVRLLTTKLQETVDENDRLRAVVAKLTEGADDAHSTLRRIYLDEAQSSTARIKAAQASINFEKSRLENVPPALELTAKPVEDLATLVHRRRRRQAALEGLPPGHPEYARWVEREDHTYPADDKPDDDTGS